MKKYITILSMFAAGFAFADDENYSGQDVSKEDFSNKSLKNSVWNGVIAVGTNYYYSDLTMANFTDANLTNAYLQFVNFTNANFTNAILTGADFEDAILIGANFTDSIINGAVIWFSDFSEDQLKTTKSYKEKNLTNVGLTYNDLSGWDFSGQDLTSAMFSSSTIANANFNNAIVNGTNFEYTVSNGFCESQLKSTKSYKYKNLRGIALGNNDLSGWDFSGQDLTSANFSEAILTGVDFSNANVKSASFWETVSKGFTEEQLKSTKGYKEKDLYGIILAHNDLSGWSFNGQNLQNSHFRYTILGDTDFSGADLRGASFDNTLNGTPIYKNTIMADGVIKNFSMVSANDSLSIRKYISTTSDETTVSAKISENDAVVSGEAVLSLEQGAELIVTNQKTLTIASDGMLCIDTDLEGSTKMTVDNEAGLTFEDGAKFIVNIIGDVSVQEGIECVALSWYDGANIEGLDSLETGKTLLLNINGATYTGDWKYETKDNSLNILINVPEPAEWAMIFGVLALGFAVYRRRK